MTSRRSTVTPILVALIILLVPLGAYVGGYCWLGVYVEGRTTDLSGQTVDIAQRIYHHDWQIAVFAPAAWVESTARGRSVTLHRWEEFVSP